MSWRLIVQGLRSCTALRRKEALPTLAGASSKTRKRNIVIPVDPGSFADAVIQLVQDASTTGSLENDLEAATKALDAADLEFQRYGDTLFEVFFAGGRLANGATLAEGGLRLSTNVSAAPLPRARATASANAPPPTLDVFVCPCRRSWQQLPSATPSHPTSRCSRHSPGKPAALRGRVSSTRRWLCQQGGELKAVTPSCCTAGAGPSSSAVWRIHWSSCCCPLSSLMS